MARSLCPHTTDTPRRRQTSTLCHINSVEVFIILNMRLVFFGKLKITSNVPRNIQSWLHLNHISDIEVDPLPRVTSNLECDLMRCSSCGVQSQNRVREDDLQVKQGERVVSDKYDNPHLLRGLWEDSLRLPPVLPSPSRSRSRGRPTPTTTASFHSKVLHWSRQVK